MCDACAQWMQKCCAQVPGINAHYTAEWTQNTSLPVVATVELSDPNNITENVALIVKGHGILPNAQVVCTHMTSRKMRAFALDMLNICDHVENLQ